MRTRRRLPVLTEVCSAVTRRFTGRRAREASIPARTMYRASAWWVGHSYRLVSDDVSHQTSVLRPDGLDIHFAVAVGPVVMLSFSTALMQPIVTIVIFPGDAGAVN